MAYLGHQPAPLLPRYEHMVRDDWQQDVGISRSPCNWLQVAENTLDPVHIEYLHMKYKRRHHARSPRSKGWVAGDAAVHD